MRRNKIIGVAVFMVISLGAHCQFQKLSKQDMFNKLKGAWAAQTIGVTYGYPYEFKYNSTFIDESIPLTWSPNALIDTYKNEPGAYDDLYVDITFMEVFDKHGLDVPSVVLADAFAKTKYKLWFANQVGRYNIMHGLKPPASGHWMNNPEAESIDFQIEADFAGLMSPGLPNYASRICDSVGHIMNYGDGYYGGVFVANMYALAFFEKDPKQLIVQALTSIPAKSTFRLCMEDVIRWHEIHPSDWKQTWFELQKKWGNDNGSPVGVFVPWNIDAKINAAYVVMGLLYGNGDFDKTMEIAIRCGNDADCNPATAAGLLGAMVGFEAIPTKWKQNLDQVENITFTSTQNSLKSATLLSLKHAQWVIERNGGYLKGDTFFIPKQTIQTVAWEQNMPGHFPVAKQEIKSVLVGEATYTFEGVGFAIAGRMAPEENESPHVFSVEVWIDGKKEETALLPASFTQRKFIPFFKYALKRSKHEVKLKVLNPHPSISIHLEYLIAYDDRPTLAVK